MRKYQRKWCFRVSILFIGVLAIYATESLLAPRFATVTIRPEIDLLLEDIASEETPDTILELVEKATKRSSSSGDYHGVDGSLSENYLAPNEVAHVTRYLRQQYGFADLRPRLKYEQNQSRRHSELNPKTREQLSALEPAAPLNTYTKDWNIDYPVERAEALRSLHGNEVVRFVNRDGAGISRMPFYGVEYVVLPETHPVPFEDRLETEEQQDSFLDRRLRNLAIANLARSRSRSPNPKDLSQRLSAMHLGYRLDFAATRNGLVNSVSDVAGFSSHAVTYHQELYPKAAQDIDNEPYESEEEPATWRVKQLYLVSLLKFDEPQVYVSEQMPIMTELNDAETRSLNDFEQSSLEKLYGGQDVVTEDATSNIQMLGSLRATKDCMACHDVDRGELLGAFSYQLAKLTR